MRLFFKKQHKKIKGLNPDDENDKELKNSYNKAYKDVFNNLNNTNTEVQDLIGIKEKAHRDLESITNDSKNKE